MTLILLTGAGFSRNWGGWLANEAFEYLLGSTELDQPCRDLLWAHNESGSGFEGALATLQNGGREDRLVLMESAIAGMFNLMNSCLDGFDGTQHTRKFLARFDAIFTLNQDLLLERHYLPVLNQTISHRWTGAQIPGLKREQPQNVGFEDGSRGWAQRWILDQPQKYG